MDKKSWRIAITGGTGLIGSAVRVALEDAGHEVRVVSRSGEKETIYWDPEKEEIDKESLEGLDAVIHLAG
ncbi:MAG: NAD-dependent epimerase/dehydratase family protein, partial [Puniceicoccales bacterium]